VTIYLTSPAGKILDRYQPRSGGRKREEEGGKEMKDKMKDACRVINVLSRLSTAGRYDDMLVEDADRATLARLNLSVLPPGAREAWERLRTRVWRFQGQRVDGGTIVAIDITEEEAMAVRLLLDAIDTGARDGSPALDEEGHGDDYAGRRLY
jgi:hypothetical protein